jgi:hypothetical protein
MSATPVITVCLPAGAPTSDLATAAAARLATHQPAKPSLCGHFLPGSRLRRGRLLRLPQGAVAGGPVRLLDLALMRRRCHDAYRARHLVWQRVVAGTRPASPFWMFVDRHHDSPRRYSLDTAQRQYLAQPRLAAMALYNALPHRVMTLPTSHLEALQTGADGYAHLGWLAAVPAHGLLDVDGRLLRPASERLIHLVSFLDEANQRLARLSPDDCLVALTC